MNTPETIDRLVNANMGLAVFHADRWAKAGSLDYDEAFSTALDGLLQAAEHHDTAQDATFGAFASLMIKRKLGTAYRRETAEMRGGKATHVSLDETVTEREDDASTYAETIPDENEHGALEHLQELDTTEKVRWMVAQLPPREAQIIAHRFGLDDAEELNLPQIGELLGVSKQRIAQIETRAMTRLADLARETFRIGNLRFAIGGKK